jgi:hypothetical protein
MCEVYANVTLFSQRTRGSADFGTRGGGVPELTPVDLRDNCTILSSFSRWRN